MKAHFTKGLQLASSPLVQHCTAIALSKCLLKFRDVVKELQVASESLEESEEDGQWAVRKRELESEIRRRCPDFGVIVAFAQQSSQEESGSSNEGVTRAALLSEAAHRLLWLYHECLPLAVAEIKFDVGKLLTSFSEDGDGGVKGLDTLKRLHILRLLKESDQFSWSGKAGMTCGCWFAIILPQ
jgi:nucleolar pre-ribosomal-associated protein 1